MLALSLSDDVAVCSGTHCAGRRKQDRYQDQQHVGEAYSGLHDGISELSL